MKKRLPLLIILAVLSLNAFSQQAVAPTLIVFPHNNWMMHHGFMSTIDNDGKTEYLPNYDDAFVSNSEIRTAIVAVEKVLKERGFQLKNLENTLDNIKKKRARNLAAAADGKAKEKSAMDELLQQANPDIKVNLLYSVEPRGPRKNIQFDLTATDAYTDEPVATCMGTVEGTMDPTHLALQKIVAGKCDDFCQQLMDYYDDIKTYGRKITLSIKVKEDSGISLRDRIGNGKTYMNFLVDWLRKNAVNSAVKFATRSDTSLELETVRIPLFDEDGFPTEAYDWGEKLRDAFQAETGKELFEDDDNALGRISYYIDAE